jgi:hypothetical protein
MTDSARARELGVSRRTIQRRREARGEPPARKPSPVADAFVEAMRFLDTGKGVELRRLLDHLQPPGLTCEARRVWRVQASATVAKLAGRRLERLREGVYRQLQVQA